MGIRDLPKELSGVGYVVRYTCGMPNALLTKDKKPNGHNGERT